MTMREFIKENREEIDECIRRVCDNCRLNDEERKEWIANDEGLYMWAKGEGVKV